MGHKEPNANEPVVDSDDGSGGGDADMDSRYETLLPSLGCIQTGYKEALAATNLLPRVADLHPHPPAAD